MKFLRRRRMSVAQHYLMLRYTSSLSERPAVVVPQQPPRGGPLAEREAAS